MDMGDPLAQIYAADNGFVVCVADEQAEAAAEKEAQKASKGGGMPAYVSPGEKQKQLVFPTIQEVVKFLTKSLPGLAKDAKGDFDAAFDEED